MAQQNTPLESIFSYSIPGAHLLQISIVRQVAEEAYKKQYFCFLTLAPGEQAQGGGRTFNFNNRINMKIDGDKVLALGHAIRAYVNGREEAIGPYTIYVDSSKSQYGTGGGGKSMLLQKGTDAKHNNVPVINIFFKAGSNSAFAFTLNPAHALAVADICEFIGHKCLELEFTKIQSNAHTGAFPNKVGVPPINTPKSVNVPPSDPFNMGAAPSLGFQNSPEQVVNNFAGSFENLPPMSFDEDIPF